MNVVMLFCIISKDMIPYNSCMSSGSKVTGPQQLYMAT